MWMCVTQLYFLERIIELTSIMAAKNLKSEYILRLHDQVIMSLLVEVISPQCFTFFK